MTSIIHDSILSLIGNTPIVRLGRLDKSIACELLAKLESFNPMSSVKDRIAKSMIEAAEAEGRLKPGMTIIEPTSGNTGIGLAMVAAVKGYPLVLTMPETMSKERRRILEAFGAEIILTPGHEGMTGAISKAESILEDDRQGYYMPQQFENPANPQVHMRTTAAEIMGSTGGALDYFVAGVGTGGTITGVGTVLKREIPTIRIVAVEPEDSPVLSKGSKGAHKIQGIGAGFVPRVLNRGVIDDVRTATYEAAVTAARRLAKSEGILCGISSGAALSVALGIARDLSADKRVLVLLPDTGERYLSTDLFNGKQTQT